jgi:putative PEP-CTERM system histidine kinase
LLTASTAVAETPASPSAAAELDLRGFEDQLAHDPEPVELDESREEWVAELKRRHEAQLNAGGSRVAVPLVGKEQLLGLLLVGYRVSGLPFSVEDFELFKCLAAQAAGGLLNLRLSQQLARSRQMEAFQSMAAFFVHDLKNTASSLSLMLQNLPTQMENPAFRQDALRAVSKAVGRLNELIARLGLLREKVRMSPVEADLNQVVQIALEAVAVAPEVSVVRSLSDGLPRMSLDPDQVQKVVTNLLINARDAVGRGGEIRVGTTAQGGWAVLSVADNGCGMSVDFLARSLFRPFQTTKKTGIGIGMFHCKTIVEAHRGRIEVESQIGKGTTFRVWLPVMGGKS